MSNIIDRYLFRKFSHIKITELNIFKLLYIVLNVLFRIFKVIYMYYFTFNSFSLSTLCKDISPSILEGSDISLFCNWKPLIPYFL